jgi:hypothetical protein
MQDYRPEHVVFPDLGDILGDLPAVPEEYRPASMLEKGLDFIGMEPHAEPEGDLFPFYVKVSIAAQIAAGIVSYTRNKDVKWAIVHGLMGPVYLGFVGAKLLTLEEARGLQYLFER